VAALFCCCVVASCFQYAPTHCGPVNLGILLPRFCLPPALKEKSLGVIVRGFAGTMPFLSSTSNVKAVRELKALSAAWLQADDRDNNHHHNRFMALFLGLPG